MRPTAFPLEDAEAFLRERFGESPEVLVVLGSGLGGLAEGMAPAVSISLSEVPGFPRMGVEGHQGRIVFGEVEGRVTLIQAGRFHYYEGHGGGVVEAPVRLAARLGARTAIFTNAAGGIASHLDPGSILLLDDHINLMGRSPLLGPLRSGEARFPDMTHPYDRELQRVAREVALENDITLGTGVYAAVLGPSYETPAEIRFLRGVGADAVGMSTVPEVITARALGMRVLGFSVITNRAAGLGPGHLDHDEVLETGRWAGGQLLDLIRAILRRC